MPSTGSMKCLLKDCGTSLKSRSLPLITRGRPLRRASSSFRLYCPWMPRTKTRSVLLLQGDSFAIGLLRRLASRAENLFVQLYPLVVLIERGARVAQFELPHVE